MHMSQNSQKLNIQKFCK